MIARLTQWRPAVGVGREEALQAWERHARLVECVPGLRRYVQHRCVTGPDGADPPYAGVGEAWFDDLEAARAALRSREWAAVIDDAGRFMDLSSVSAAWAAPRVVREQEPGGLTGPAPRGSR